MNLQAGTFLQNGKYRIVRFISSGGFGCTYEAEQTGLGRVAIKEFFVSDICNRDSDTGHISVGVTTKVEMYEKLRDKFRKEAKAVFNLSHPGIVHVSDVFDENGTTYFVMEYIDGCSLDSMVSQYGPMSEANALGFMRQVCDALAYVHANNRLHLDIKPGNIMVDQSGRAVLIDFGASKQYDNGTGQNLSTLLGFTPGYAPPEQMSVNVQNFLPATDIYSLGATLYTLLTGETPTDSASRFSGVEVAALPATISASTRSAVESALQLNKSARPQTVAEFSAMLFGESGAAQTPSPKPLSSMSRDTQRFESRPTERKVAPPPLTDAGDVDEDTSDGKSRTPIFTIIIAVLIAIALALVGAIFFLQRGSGNSSGTDALDCERGHADFKHLDLYTIYENTARFFTPEEWKAVPESERSAYTKKGVVVCCDTIEAFYVDLHDSGETMTWYEAESRYGESAFPSETQCRVMASNCEDINKAIKAFGGDKHPEYWYWGKSWGNDYKETESWMVNMNSAYVNRGAKKTTLRVRTVGAVSLSATSSSEKPSKKSEAPKRGHLACNHLDLYTKYQGKSVFFTVDEWIMVPESERSAYTKKGVVVKSNGVSPFYVALSKSCDDQITWYEAVKHYDESELPSLAQCEEMAVNCYDICKAIVAFGGDKYPNIHYWGKSTGVQTACYVDLDISHHSEEEKESIHFVRVVGPVSE